MPQDPLVWIASDLFAILQAEADRCYPLETGGLLLGYRVGSEWVVQDVLGPGPDGRHRRHSFDPDHTWHAKELRERFERFGGRQVYIGDWHTHPDGRLALSARDHGAMARIIRSVDAQTPEPLSAVLAGTPQEWRMGVWSGELVRSWWGHRVRTTEAALRQIADEACAEFDAANGRSS